MFYEECTVKKLLNCQKCNEKYNEPYLIPCGFTICQNCAQDLAENPCGMCNKPHETPLNGFPLNQIILSLINEQPKEIYRGKEADRLKRNLKYINEKFSKLSTDVTNKEDKIKEHCLELRRKVQLKTEELINEITNLNEELIVEINTHEKEWLKKQRAKKPYNKDLYDELRSQIVKFNDEQSKYLQQTQIDDDEIIEANELAEKYRSQIDQCLDDVSVFIFDGKQIEFETSGLSFDRRFLGHFYPRMFIDSKKLKTQSLDDDLMDQKDGSLVAFFVSRAGVYSILYQSEQDKLVVIMFDPKENRKQRKEICGCKNLYDTARKSDMIAVNIFNENEKDSLITLDESFNVILVCNSFNGSYLKGANEQFIFCFDCDMEHLLVFDWSMNKVELKKEFQFGQPDEAFYLSENLNKIDKRGDKYILLSENCLEIMSESSGRVAKAIPIKTENFEINTAGDRIIVDDSRCKKIFAYNLNGDLSYEIKLNGFNFNYLTLVDQNEKFHFYDTDLNEILY